jgi:hypothetical protein
LLAFLGAGYDQATPSKPIVKRVSGVDHPQQPMVGTPDAGPGDVRAGRERHDRDPACVTNLRFLALRMLVLTASRWPGPGDRLRHGCMRGDG